MRRSMALVLAALSTVTGALAVDILGVTDTPPPDAASGPRTGTAVRAEVQAAAFLQKLPQLPDAHIKAYVASSLRLMSLGDDEGYRQATAGVEAYVAQLMGESADSVAEKLAKVASNKQRIAGILGGVAHGGELGDGIQVLREAQAKAFANVTHLDSTTWFKISGAIDRTLAARNRPDKPLVSSIPGSSLTLVLAPDPERGVRIGLVPNDLMADGGEYPHENPRVIPLDEAGLVGSGLGRAAGVGPDGQVPRMDGGGGRLIALAATLPEVWVEQNCVPRPGWSDENALHARWVGQAFVDIVGQLPDADRATVEVKKCTPESREAEVRARVARYDETTRLMDRLYQWHVGRKPSGEEQGLWVRALTRKGVRMCDLETALAHSPEALLRREQTRRPE